MTEYFDATRVELVEVTKHTVNGVPPARKPVVYKLVWTQSYSPVRRKHWVYICICILCVFRECEYSLQLSLFQVRLENERVYSLFVSLENECVYSYTYVYASHVYLENVNIHYICLYFMCILRMNVCIQYLCLERMHVSIMIHFMCIWVHIQVYMSKHQGCLWVQGNRMQG